MNEFYLPKKSIDSQQYLIEQAIYEDIYQYRDNDNITLKMLQSIILNNNKHLFIQVLSKKILSSQEIIYLLETVCTEGDDYFEFFEILFKKSHIEEEVLFSLLKQSILSSGIKILNILLLEYNEILKKYLTQEFIQNCIEKNPDQQVVIFLMKHIDKSFIFNSNCLQETITNDYIKLFILYTKNQEYNDWNNYLDAAIFKNAYDIIDYILTQITTYNIQQDSDKYNDFFDYLITEKLSKIMLFLDKINNLQLLGNNNLEKVLLSVDNHEDFELLLFKYNLSIIDFDNESLQQKIKKCVLNKKLQKKLIIKNSKEIKKI